jgi:tetratricopeptide (TPR) repeat protein
MRPRLLLAVVSAFIALLALVGPAHAEDAATKRARTSYAKGEKLFALGRFDEALEAYEAAYDAKPLPGFLFNIGQCHRNLGDLDAAIFSFQKYLELAPDADNHDSVLDLIEDLEEQKEREEAEARDKKLQAPPRTRDERPRRPLYKKWWFWTGVAVVAVAGGTATYLLLRDDGVPDTDLGHVVFR